MIIEYLNRQLYKEKDSSLLLDEMKDRWGEFFAIPEGGTNQFAVQGCEEFGRLINEIPADYVCLPVGTGATMAGLLRSISDARKLLGFSVLKGGSFLRTEIETHAGCQRDNWELMTEYSYGGYGKRNQQVATFIKQFFEHTGIPLDFVYTGKMMCGIFDLINQGYFAGKTVVAIHTGGLQGHSEAGGTIGPSLLKRP